MGDTSPGLSRRDFIAGAGVAVAAAGLAAGCATRAAQTRVAEHTGQARVLSGEQLMAVMALARVIIPGEPGRGVEEAGVGEYIQAVLATGEHREAFLTGLERAMEQAEAELGCALHACSARAAEPLVARLSREHAQAPAERPFFGLLKQLVVAGYYTSAVGLMALEGTTRSMYPAYPGACPDGKIGALAP